MRGSLSATMYSAQGYHWSEARGFFYSRPSASISVALVFSVCRNRFRGHVQSLRELSPSKLSHSGHSVRVSGPAGWVELSKKAQTRALTACDTSPLAAGRKRMPQITCSVCNAQYSSERELRDHLAMAHRKFGPAQSSLAPGDKKAGVSAALVDRLPT